MQKGKIGVTTENIFPIIKKFLYSDHEIFLREIISNAVDATQKLKTLQSSGDFKGEAGDLSIRVSLNKKKRTITVSDSGVGMTRDELDRYLNQIAFSSANDFLEKYKEQSNAIIGHFGLGFYSSFMVSEKVEVITRSWQEGSESFKWACDGSPEFTIEEATREGRGTDVVMHIDKESKEFLDEARIESLLNKYCKFLPVEIIFGKEREWIDGKYVDTEKERVINNTTPAWTKKPSDLKEEDYNNFYHELYPGVENPLFNIHLNVDYPFRLTGILYFPKIRSNFEIQKNKIQLYCNQVFVTDSVEGVVPEFLTLLHGVIDSPDIPLNVSRSYLQSDSNVKKISSHITRKVADRLNQIFKKERNEFEKKWDDLKLFIQYGMITEEKFFDKASGFALLKSCDDSYHTIDEYKKKIGEKQTDKDKKIVVIYATDKLAQHSYIEKARARGYDVLIMDGQLDNHFLNHLESKIEDVRFVRVDSDIPERLVPAEEDRQSSLDRDRQVVVRHLMEAHLDDRARFSVSFEPMDESASPVVITQPEFLRRMRDMSQMGGGPSLYGELPESYNLVVNTNHPVITKLSDEAESNLAERVEPLRNAIKKTGEKVEFLSAEHGNKKAEEISQAEKDDLEAMRKELSEKESELAESVREWGTGNNIAKQVIDLALLENNMLRGEELAEFIRRSTGLLPGSKQA